MSAKRDESHVHFHQPSTVDTDTNSYTSTSSTDVLTQLFPVRRVLTACFTDREIACLCMRLSPRSISTLLGDYTFENHVFIVDSAASLKSLVQTYQRWGVARSIRHMCLGMFFRDSLLDSVTHDSLLPKSLKALVLGQMVQMKVRESLFSNLSKFNADDISFGLFGGSEGTRNPTRDREYNRAHAQLRWSLPRFPPIASCFDLPLPPSAITASVCYLQLGHMYNKPLRLGSLPPSLTFLECGDCYNQPFPPGVLPASLIYLSLGDSFNQPLEASHLPGSLRYLRLGVGFQRSIDVRALPSSLLAIDMHYAYSGLRQDQMPIMPRLPTSLTNLRLPASFNQPLQSLNLVQLQRLSHLHLGCDFNHPLSPGILPSSLRSLVFSTHYCHPLPPGAIPAGVELVDFPSYCSPPALGVLPDSLQLLVLGPTGSELDHTPLLPARLRWLQLRHHHRGVDNRCLPDGCTVISPF